MSQRLATAPTPNFRKNRNITEENSAIDHIRVRMHAGTHLESASFTAVPRRFIRVIAVIFIVQIVLPFTAPLQIVDLCDLFAVQVHRSSSPSPSMTTLAMSEATPETAGMSLIAPATTSGVVSTPAPALLSTRVSSASTSSLFSAPQVQRTVLRL